MSMCIVNIRYYEGETHTSVLMENSMRLACTRPFLLARQKQVHICCCAGGHSVL